MLLFSTIPLLENLDSHFFLRSLVAAVDITLVAYLIYRLILLARPTAGKEPVVDAVADLVAATCTRLAAEG